MKNLLWYLIAGTKGGETRGRIIELLRKNPSNANKIAEVQQTIIKLLDTYHPNDLFLQRDNERIVKEEIDTLMQELESLRKHQTEHPDVGIADKLRSIRITLQSLAKK